MFPSLTRDEVFRIETPRLWLRWPRLEDAAGLAQWSGRPEVAGATSTVPVGITTAEMAAKIADMRAINAAGAGLCFAIVRQGADGYPIGMLGGQAKPGKRFEIGYHLNPEHWGQGRMTEAVQALCAQAFELASIDAIEAGVRPSNIASMRVLEKCGFDASGVADHESPLYGRYPIVTYALARSRPSALKAAAQRRYRAATTATRELGLV